MTRPREKAASSLVAVVAQIMVIDIVFSLDSVITAVGMVSEVQIMIAANVVALGIMLAAATPISDFVDRHPTIKMLALSFLVLIGTNLVAEGLGPPHPEGLHLFRDVLLVPGGDAEPQAPCETGGGEAARHAESRGAEGRGSRDRDRSEDEEGRGM